MLRVKKGYDVDYYLDATAKGRDAYYTDPITMGGEPPGLWHGRGAEALGLTGEVDPLIMKALYTHGLDPRDEATADRATWGQTARYGSAPRNYRSAEEIYAGLLEAHADAGPEERAELRAEAGKAARQSVGFYDMVLSASKSHTLLWVACERAAREAAAAGDTEAAARYGRVAHELEEILLDGHRAMLEFLADKAGYARTGHHGGGAGGWVPARDWTTAQFLQHDSREHDPQLHAHATTLNKVMCEDGKVRALDYSLILQWKDSASAYADRHVAASGWQRLGLLWELGPDGRSLQIAGMDPDATRLFSKRTAAITPTLAALEARFRAETGRVPSNREHAALAEQASNVTRASKVFDGETRDGQLARWAAEYDSAFGQSVSTIAEQVLGRDAGPAVRFSERDVVARALAEMEDTRQAWSRSNLMTAVFHALPVHLGAGPEKLLPLLEGITDKAQALVTHINPRTGPQNLDAKYYRADGESVFIKPHAQRFATATQLLGEAELRAAAVRRGAPAWTAEDAAEIVARFARAGRELSADQAAALTGILTSGAAVEVLNAPAGTGKSFLVGTLADTWPLTGRPVSTPPGPDGTDPGDPAAGEGPRVFGIAYGQRQAGVLAEEGVTALNIRRWLDGQSRLAAGHGNPEDEGFRLRAGDLLVVDEAGAASNPDLVAIHRICEAAGVKLLLVGDQRQLVAVGAGGALADIAERGIEYQLAEVRRFHDAWEGPASLRLRDGDESVVGEYAKHGRLVDAGTVEQAEQAAGRAWLADTLTGRDALIVVGSNAAAARLSNQLRAELVKLGRVDEQGVPLGLGPALSEWRGTVAGVGDLVQARRNAWHLEGWSDNPEAPINRQTYRVTQTHPTGGMTVARVTGRDTDGTETLADPILLPASYVRERVTLAYASTVHAAHGRNTGAGYGVLAPGTDGPSAYVEATRGRETNVLFVVTQHTDESQPTGETARTHRRSAAEVLADVIRPPEVDPNRTALTQGEQAAEDARATQAHLDPLTTVIADLTAGRTQRWLDELAAAGHLPDKHRAALAADEARTSLNQLLRTVELSGHDPAQALADGVTRSSLDGSTSVAQVLHYRIRHAYRDELTPHIGSYVDLLPQHLPEQARAGLAALAEAADDRRAELGARLAVDPPQWAREALGSVPDSDTDAEARAVWEQRAGWAGSYRELAEHDDPADALGAAPARGLAEKHAAFHAAHAALGLPEVGADEEDLSEGKLRAYWAAWQRELNTAPRYVADELDATHEALRQARTDATVWQARADVEHDPLVRDELAAAAAQARERREQLAGQVEQLEVTDHARAVFFLDTAVTRDKAERSRVAAGWRGIDLTDTSDHITADDWLRAHQAEQIADEDARPITEDDLARDDTAVDEVPGVGRRDDARRDERDERDVDDARADRQGVDEPVVEAVAPDLRDTSRPDLTEKADPATRRRVPPVDDSTATFDRAQRLLADVAARQEAERAAAAHAAELEPEDDQLRAELARQAALDEEADTTSAVTTDDDGGNAVLDRLR
jgi:TrwC relaxase/AAA domain